MGSYIASLGPGMWLRVTEHPQSMWGLQWKIRLEGFIPGHEGPENQVKEGLFRLLKRR